MISRGLYTILEIEPTDNIKDIKRAYAKVIRKYHPEENPEEWKRVHDAYEQILESLSKEENNTIKALLDTEEHFAEKSAQKSDDEPQKEKLKTAIAEEWDDDSREAMRDYAEQAMLRYNEEKEAEQQELEAYFFGVTQYKELARDIRKIFASNTTAIGNKIIVTKFEYNEVHGWSKYLTALGDKQFVECLYQIISNHVFDADAALLMIHDIEIAKQNNVSIAASYSDILKYLNDCNNLHSVSKSSESGSGDNQRSEMRTIILAVAIIALAIKIVGMVIEAGDERERRALQEQRTKELVTMTMLESDDSAALNLYITIYDMSGEDGLQSYLIEQGFTDETVEKIISRVKAVKKTEKD